MTATQLLGEVLMRARATVGRSPERVGEQVGVSGRTIRRLEEGASTRPRRTTLQALAGYYGLNPEFLVTLTIWGAQREQGVDVRSRLNERAVRELGPEVTETLLADVAGERELAMRLARAPQTALLSSAAPGSGRAWTATALLQALGGPGGQGTNDRDRIELLSAVGGLVSLDRRRRRLVAELIEQLGEIQAADVERRPFVSGGR